MEHRVFYSVQRTTRRVNNIDKTKLCISSLLCYDRLQYKITCRFHKDSFCYTCFFQFDFVVDYR